MNLYIKPIAKIGQSSPAITIPITHTTRLYRKQSSNAALDLGVNCWDQKKKSNPAMR
jgi:hypothetical protein